MKTYSVETLRENFVTRAEKPTYAELAEEFNAPVGSVCRLASEEGWVSLRAAHLEAKAKECDAMSIVLQAVKIDKTIIASFGDTILTAIRRVNMAIDSIPEDRAASTQLECLNTASFALKNLSETAKNVGIVGVSRLFGENGKEANGRWNPEMLQQINVTVQNLQAQAAKPAEPVAEME